MGMERLDKIVAATGKWSRKEVKALIKEGRIWVNGNAAVSGEQKVEPNSACITVDGEEIAYQKYTYLMLHKPAGVLSATEDRRQKTVLDLLPSHLQRRGLFPVGRLDRDTEGLLLLTNDGALAHRLLSPKKHVDKVYFAQLDGAIGPEDVRAFAEGIQLGDVLCMPALLQLGEEENTAFVTLHEGKFHQIKRMFSSRGRTVLYLKRLTMGPLTLDPDLPKGKYRYLSDEEIANLCRFEP